MLLLSVNIQLQQTVQQRPVSENRQHLVRLVYTGSYTVADFECASSNRGFQNAFDTLNTPAPFRPTANSISQSKAIFFDLPVEGRQADT